MTPAAKSEEFLDRAIQYAKDVRSGDQIACRLVKLAVKRWFDDLDNAHERGFFFDEAKALRYFRFVATHCRHYIGHMDGKPLDFEPWQCFAEANIHGWVNREGYRRFRMSFEEVGRKNGKSTKHSASANYYLFGDAESAAEIYIGATKKEQTKEIFNATSAMIRKDRKLRAVSKILRNDITYKNSKIMRLSRDSQSMDGFNVHVGLVDELHAHPNAFLWNVLRSAMGARKQPILRGITTAGFDRNSFAYNLRNMMVKILEGHIMDAIFVLIYTIDDEEKWLDEDEWKKANPNLGISVSLEDLRQQAEEAQQMPSAKLEFLTKRLNVWTFSHSTWMNMSKWSDCKDDSLDPIALFDPDYDFEDHDFYQIEAYAGLDLASVEDLVSLAIKLDFNGRKVLLQRSYVPKEKNDERVKSGDQTYMNFIEQGTLVEIPGAVVDYEFIKKDIHLVCERLDIKAIAYDRWNSSQLVIDLSNDDIPMVGYGQGMTSMSPPSKELLRLVLTVELAYNDQLLTWAVSNVVVAIDAAGNIKPDKGKVKDKIDPAVASIMAVGISMANDDGGASDQVVVD